MGSIERVGDAIGLRQPDRVPVDLHNFQPAALAVRIAHVPGVPAMATLMADAMLAAWREFHHDMILLENGTACNAQACGVEVHYRDDTAPVVGGPS